MTDRSRYTALTIGVGRQNGPAVVVYRVLPLHPGDVRGRFEIETPNGPALLDAAELAALAAGLSQLVREAEWD